MTLPQELVDAILEDVVGPGAHAALKACSMVARSFVMPCQRRLFRFLTLTSKTVGIVSARFSDRPYLASYVRDLHVDMHLDTKLHQKPLVTTFRLLNKVRRIAVSSYSWQTWAWDSFPNDFCEAFVSLLTLPSLRCLALTRCRGVPFALIRHALTSYKEVGLLVAGIDVDQKIELFPAPPSDAGKPLARLLLNYAPGRDAAFHSLMVRDDSTEPFTSPRHLELAIPIQGSLGGLEMIALKYSGSLQHLVVNFWQRHDHAIQLPALPNLQKLTLKASVGRLRIPVAILSTMISLPACTPHLEVLNIVVDAEYDGSGKVVDQYNVCEVELAFENLSRLREVNWGIFSDDVVAFEERIQRVLPRASAAGLFSFSTWSWRSKHDPMVHFSQDSAHRAGAAFLPSIFILDGIARQRKPRNASLEGCCCEERGQVSSVEAEASEANNDALLARADNLGHGLQTAPPSLYFVHIDLRPCHHRVQDDLLDEILSQILSSALEVWDDKFRDTSTISLFAPNPAQTAAQMWLRIGTPLFLEVVIICSTAQAAALTDALRAEDNLGKHIKKPRWKADSVLINERKTKLELDSSRNASLANYNLGGRCQNALLLSETIQLVSLPGYGELRTTPIEHGNVAWAKRKRNYSKTP
ncbi:hypothetical protein K438DRAFT_1757954 [Mycena galopus ATCC 62051]|nr:hypothetical protein K438DRAFT_1757954 [Mycena galopus ATCC 62051]